jgi:hypothetical protein
MPNTIPPRIAIAKAITEWLAISETAISADRSHHNTASIKRKWDADIFNLEDRKDRKVFFDQIAGTPLVRW